MPRHEDEIPLPQEQEYEPARSRSTNKISVLRPTVLQLESQNLVTFSSQRHGIITVEPHEGLYRKHQCLTDTGIYHIKPGKPFKVLVANFTNRPVKLNALQEVASPDVHSNIITE